MDIEKIKKQWKDYNEKIVHNEFMDIGTHTSMAMQVGGLIDHIEALERRLENSLFDTYFEPTPKKTFKLNNSYSELQGRD